MLLIAFILIALAVIAVSMLNSDNFNERFKKQFVNVETKLNYNCVLAPQFLCDYHPQDFVDACKPHVPQGSLMISGHCTDEADKQIAQGGCESLQCIYE